MHIPYHFDPLLTSTVTWPRQSWVELGFLPNCPYFRYLIYFQLLASVFLLPRLLTALCAIMFWLHIPNSLVVVLSLKPVLTHLDVEGYPSAASCGTQLGRRVTGFDLLQNLRQPAGRKLLQGRTSTPCTNTKKHIALIGGLPFWLSNCTRMHFLRMITSESRLHYKHWFKLHIYLCNTSFHSFWDMIAANTFLLWKAIVHHF